jgi:hypothetical protein
VRRPAALLAVVLLSGCVSANGSNGKEVDHQDLGGLVAMPVSMRSGMITKLPVIGLTVSGSLINHESVTLTCSPAMFELVSANSDRHPLSGYCAQPRVKPNEATEFSVTFPAFSNEGTSLRLNHPDGTYELKDLAIPPP